MVFWTTTVPHALRRRLVPLAFVILQGCSTAPHIKYTMLGVHKERPHPESAQVEVYVSPQQPKRSYAEVARIFADPEQIQESWGRPPNPADVIALCQEKARQIGADAILVTIEREPYAEGSAYSDANVGVASSESLYRNSYQVTAIRWKNRK